MTTTVKIKTGSHEIELTIDEAREAYQELGKLFGSAKETVLLPYPYLLPYSPTVAPWTYPREITFNSGTVTKL